MSESKIPEDLRGLYGSLHADTFELWGKRGVTKKEIIAMIDRIAALTERVDALEGALRLLLLSDVNHSDYHMRRTAIEQARKALGGAS